MDVFNLNTTFSPATSNQTNLRRPLLQCIKLRVFVELWACVMYIHVTTFAAFTESSSKCYAVPVTTK